MGRYSRAAVASAEGRTSEPEAETDTAFPLRVLIENADDRVREAQVELFRARGCHVTSCGGPRRRPDGCALVEDGGCSILDEVDVVLFGLDLDRDCEVAVLDAVRSAYPTLPVVLEIPSSTARRHQHRLAGCTVIAPFDAEKLLRGVAG